MEFQGLTTKELSSVEECLKMEVLCAAKLQGFEREVRDSELRETCRQGLRTCGRHIDELMNLLH